MALWEAGFRVSLARAEARAREGECVSNHDMHGEHFSVDPASVNQLAHSLEESKS